MSDRNKASIFVAVFLIISWAMISLVFAGPYDAEWNPPSRFDHKPTRQCNVVRLPQRLVVGKCNYEKARAGFKENSTDRQRGCVIYSSTRCIMVIIDRPYGLTTPKAVIRHENGHINGWPADHGR